MLVLKITCWMRTIKIMLLMHVPSDILNSSPYWNDSKLWPSRYNFKSLHTRLKAQNIPHVMTYLLTAGANLMYDYHEIRCNCLSHDSSHGLLRFLTPEKFSLHLFGFRSRLTCQTNIEYFFNSTTIIVDNWHLREDQGLAGFPFNYQRHLCSNRSIIWFIGL